MSIEFEENFLVKFKMCQECVMKMISHIYILHSKFNNHSKHLSNWIVLNFEGAYIANTEKSRSLRTHSIGLRNKRHLLWMPASHICTRETFDTKILLNIFKYSLNSKSNVNPKPIIVFYTLGNRMENEWQSKVMTLLKQELYD